MIFRTVNDITIPALGFGTWPLKGADCARAVSTALQTGYRHIDTAAMYENEDGVGDGVRASGVARDDIHITTKVWHDRLSRSDLLQSARDSLDRLKLDHVDLLLVHWPTQDVPLSETIGALLEARSMGLTRSVGVSNFPSALLREAQHLAGGALVTNQVEYHPFLSQKTLLSAASELGMTLSAYCPIAKGKVNNDPVMTEIAAAHGKSPVQVTLRWLLQQEGVIAVPKSGTPERIKANFEVFDFELSEEDMSRIFALGSPAGRIVNVDFAPVWDVA